MTIRERLIVLRTIRIRIQIQTRIQTTIQEPRIVRIITRTLIPIRIPIQTLTEARIRQILIRTGAATHRVIILQIRIQIQTQIPARKVIADSISNHQENSDFVSLIYN